MALFTSYSAPAPMYVGGANMGDPNMGNILGDAWDYVKKNPLVVVPPLFVAQKTLQAVPSILRTGRNEVQATLAPFRPAPPPSSVDALTSALTGSGGAPGGEPGSSSSLPIILGAGALGLVLVLALGRKKKS